jgi:amidase
MKDPLGAFCSHIDINIPGAAAGPLAGLTLAVKDIFDIAGVTTGCGNPDWLRTHQPASATASVVQRLIDAGATVVGKTITEELAYSVIGENFHYGTPLNTAAPDRVPGGSSSGSVSAVAGGRVDLALGSDTGGSVRVPASFCGIYGIRTSHGRIPLDHTMPLAPSFDTVGWFARDAALLRRAGEVVLGPDTGPQHTPRLLIAEDAFELAEPAARAALEPVVAGLVAALGLPVARIRLSAEGLGVWYGHFRVLQAREAWQAHGAWIEQVEPKFGPGVRERFAWAKTVSDEMVAAANAARARIRAGMDELVGDGSVIAMPAAPAGAPRKKSSQEVLESYRTRTLSLTCPAGHAGLPQVTLPLARAEGCPLGLSLIASGGSDLRLLALVEKAAAARASRH